MAIAMIIATATTTCTFTGIIPENNLPVSAAEEVMKTDDGFQYEVNNNGEVTITKYIGTDTDVDIPSKIDGKPVTSIGEYAFYNYNDLISVTILDSVISIGAHAFDHCENLESIKIPNSVTTIKEYTFSYCGPLEITIPRSVTTIEDNAFNYCWATIYGYKDSYAETFAQNSSFEFKEIQELEQTLGITSFTADKVSPQLSGTQIKLTVNATGSGKLQYKFIIRDNKTGNWYKLRDYAELNVFTWKTGNEGDKTLYVDVKDENGKVTRESMNYTVKKIIDSEDSKIKSSMTINNLQGSALEVILKAEVESEGDLQYRFLFKDNEGNENIIRDFSTSNSIAWITPTIKNKEIYVEVKDEDGNIFSEKIQES